MTRPFTRLAAPMLAAVLFAACTQHDAKTVERSASPLIGTWTRDGDTPKGASNGGPQFTKLTFAADGSLDASYVAGGLGSIVGSSPSIKSERDTTPLPTRRSRSPKAPRTGTTATG